MPNTSSAKIKIRNLRQQVGEEILTALRGASVPDNGPVSAWGRQLDCLDRARKLLDRTDPNPAAVEGGSD